MVLKDLRNIRTVFKGLDYLTFTSIPLVIISASKSALQAMHINVQRSGKHLGALSA